MAVENSEHVPATPELVEMLVKIAKSLVDAPEQVSLSEKVEGPTPVLELRVSKEDIGKVIGRSGRTAEALRTLVNAAAARHKTRYLLHIVEA